MSFSKISILLRWTGTEPLPPPPRPPTYSSSKQGCLLFVVYLSSLSNFFYYCCVDNKAYSVLYMNMNMKKYFWHFEKVLSQSEKYLIAIIYERFQRFHCGLDIYIRVFLVNFPIYCNIPSEVDPWGSTQQAPPLSWPNSIISRYNI